jgi:hypothetical protein
MYGNAPRRALKESRRFGEEVVAGKVRGMTWLERRMLAIALVFGVLTLCVASNDHFGLPSWSVPTAQAASGTFYGANEAWVGVAASEWPQRSNNWCGIANIEVIANYSFMAATNDPNYFPFGNPANTPAGARNQASIVNDMDNTSVALSQWGVPSWNGTGPGFQADIARDGGTDPRSIAWGALYESAAGDYLHQRHPGYLPPRWATRAYSIHDVIYHGGESQALTGLARMLENYQAPVSITMAHGLHSDIVSGVYSTNDPDVATTAAVTAINVWDPAVGAPGGGYQSSREVTWDAYSFSTDTSMWGTAYQSNSGYDPDPAVGPYTPNSKYPTHWINYYTLIGPDNHTTVSPDYALDEYGNVMSHP